MTPEHLLELVDAGETLDVEFKGEQHHPLNDGDLVETVVGLANRPGDHAGLLLVGVEDDGRITRAQLRSESVKSKLVGMHALVSIWTRSARMSHAGLGDGLMMSAVPIRLASATQTTVLQVST
jgi:ATP-dependent DNA helicase RecG